MNKSEALVVMHEILGALRESVIISGVSLDYLGSEISKSPGGCQIKMICDFDDCAHKRIQPILDMRNLRIDEKKGTVIIFSP